VTAIRLRIGDAFQADDPLARFITGLAVTRDDWLRSLEVGRSRHSESHHRHP